VLCTLTVAACGGSAAAPATPTAIPDTFLLAATDLRDPGWRRTADPAAAEPGWPWALHQCVLYDEADYPAQQHRVAARWQAYAATGGRSIVVTVERFAAGWAARSMQDVRAVVETCARYEYSDRVADFLDSHAVTAESFAGDESLQATSTRIAPPGPTRVHHTAVVRLADMVITIVGTGVKPQEIIRLAKLLATRA
jgi:hypothetical protein